MTSNIKRLYLFNCKGNYDVCGGSLVFYTSDYLNELEALAHGRAVLTDLGSCYAATDMDATCVYLGTFMPHELDAVEGVITYETGEY